MGTHARPPIFTLGCAAGQTFRGPCLVEFVEQVRQLVRIVPPQGSLRGSFISCRQSRQAVDNRPLVETVTLGLVSLRHPEAAYKRANTHSRRAHAGPGPRM